ncbi:MAG: alpha-galactosidase [Bifidobacterium aquikefiri]|uniref:alpha-galactosidase n=1 Tax=Bifidobacterium aquikefiri TaxID=1653207 RepID=A0A261GCG3_9BIFI|nr:alpha-galactosidase [Bifidobacterium aquikefiri]OZG68845.1 alpha-galactosidase [Bifidobacterium aquikefiri]
MNNVVDNTTTPSSNLSSGVWQRFTETASDGTQATVLYGEDSQADAAILLLLRNNELPRIVQWGRPISHAEYLVNCLDALKPQRVSGGLDDTDWPSIIPTQAEAWTGSNRFVVRRDGIELFCCFQTVDNSIAIDNRTVSIIAIDPEHSLTLLWKCEITESGLLRQQATITNGFKGDASAPTAQAVQTSLGIVSVDKIELAYPVPEEASEILSTTGHHLRERSPQRQPFNIGRIERLSMVGRPDFDASLLLSAGIPGFGFSHGEVYSTHVGWSGNSVLSAERTTYTQGLIGGAELLVGGEMQLGKGESYTTPWVYGAYGEGLNAVAARLHGFVRAQHPNLASKPRPVILNTWEAVYFEHSFDTLKALADKAKDSGVERFVVDDGWFMHRRDDTAGLGDWQIDPAVWPQGEKSLGALAHYVHGLDMEFGLWFEPEMINPDSDTARAHPDWIMHAARNRLPMQGRSQQVMDLTNPAAYDYVFNAMDALVDSLGIDYIKWDHNKLVTEPVSPYSGLPCVHAQTEAVYRIFKTLKQHHQGLEIETCSSGGGRVDLGILSLADRIWASDCVDPVERADIQRYTSLLVPPEMIGEHIGASPAHSTMRATSQQMRMATAFFGHLGIEWDLQKQNGAALERLAQWVGAYKQNRTMFESGTVIHADSSDPSVRVDGVIAKDRSRAVVRFTQLTTSKHYPVAPIRIPGLDADEVYRVRPLQVSLDLEGLGNGQSKLGWWNEQGTILPGEFLADCGIRPPTLNPAQAVLFEIVKI